MRKYIFTKIERGRLENWLANKGYDPETRKIFTRIRHNFSSLKSEVDLLSKVTYRLRDEGRLRTKVKPREPSNTVPEVNTDPKAETRQD